MKRLLRKSSNPGCEVFFSGGDGMGFSLSRQLSVCFENVFPLRPKLEQGKPLEDLIMGKSVLAERQEAAHNLCPCAKDHGFDLSQSFIALLAGQFSLMNEQAAIVIRRFDFASAGQPLLR